MTQKHTVIVKHIEPDGSLDEYCQREKSYRVTIKEESMDYVDSGFDPEPLLWFTTFIVYIITSIVTLNPVLALFITPFIMIPVALGGGALLLVGMILYGIIKGLHSWHQTRLAKKESEERKKRWEMLREIESRGKYYAAIAAEEAKAAKTNTKPETNQISQITTDVHIDSSSDLNTIVTKANNPPSSKKEMFLGFLIILYVLGNLIVWSQHFHSFFKGLMGTVIMVIVAFVAVLVAALIYALVRRIAIFLYKYTIGRL